MSAAATEVDIFLFARRLLVLDFPPLPLLLFRFRPFPRPPDFFEFLLSEKSFETPLTEIEPCDNNAPLTIDRGRGHQTILSLLTGRPVDVDSQVLLQHLAGLFDHGPGRLRHRHASPTRQP